MTVVAVIPARFASTRFPGKPLAKDTGRFMIEHVYECVASCPVIDRTLVATDDRRIADAVRSFGGECQMTRTDHVSGTDRVGEVAAAMNLLDEDIVLNVQGDEPEIARPSLEALVRMMRDATDGVEIGTIAAPFADDGPCEGPGSPLDPNCVKVVVDANGRAMYFSRSAIPHPRDTNGVVDRPSRWLLHMGVYAFRAGTLRTLTTGRLSVGTLEKAESLEQLRWMEHGFSIAVVVVSERSVGIDTPADYAAFVRRVRERAQASSWTPHDVRRTSGAGR